MHQHSPVRVLLVVLALALLIVAPARAIEVHSWGEAKATATELQVPIVLDFYAVWCGPCKAFDRDRKADPQLVERLENAVLFKMDAEKGSGLEWAEEFEVAGYPTFVVVNPDRETIQRWWGYGDAASWVARVDAAAADPTTIAQKEERFAGQPTLEDAKVLAYYYESSSKFDRAVEFYGELKELDVAKTEHYDEAIFEAMVSGVSRGQFRLDQVVEVADALVANPDTPADRLIGTAMQLKGMFKREGELERWNPYLAAAVERSESATDPHVQATRGRLLVDYSLRVQKDPESAIQHRRALMDEGWDEDPAALNSFAWWCFENEINLEEAEGLARRGAELATDPEDKANILDTVAEICNARGDCRDAVTLIEQAMELNPENEYLEKQLQRFQKIVAEGD